MNNIRVFYNKMDRAKYISHLDITRCMQRALKRAGLPIWYTEGFNPHIYLTFALPLSLGYESESEVMDLRLIEDIPLNEVKERLNKVLPPDIQVTKVAEPVNKPDAITNALYKITITNETKNGEDLLSLFHAFMEQEKIEVEKHTKKGKKIIDIKPDCTLLKAYANEHGIVLRLNVSAGINKNINPTLLTDEFIKRNNLTNAATSVLRKVLYMENGEEFI